MDKFQTMFISVTKKERANEMIGKPRRKAVRRSKKIQQKNAPNHQKKAVRRSKRLQQKHAPNHQCPQLPLVTIKRTIPPNVTCAMCKNELAGDKFGACAMCWDPQPKMKSNLKKSQWDIWENNYIFHLKCYQDYKSEKM